DGSLAPDRVFLADTTGDGKDDKIMFAGGSWYVSVSSGTGFWAPQVWRPGHGVGSNDQIVGDFNGDNLADAAVYFAVNGKWYVALSTGGGFGYPGEWSYEHGLGTTLRVAGDTTGDGKDDIVYYSQNIFKWWVGASSGGGFWSLNEWAYDGTAYTGASNVFVADVNGDRRDDKILFFANTGNWYVGTSSGGGFWSLQLWIVGHGAGS
ncbi:MAG TPA: VCBS repeat-containing protein, partial [Candidatus Saccharimonadales bacterium]|nr:VCBS repeat-containing protein [Candidatus Saccharimonadales bacterium]